MAPDSPAATKKLERRLISAGCASARVRMLLLKYPQQLGNLTERFERLAELAARREGIPASLETILSPWYLGSEKNDSDAIAALLADLELAETQVQHLGNMSRHP